MNKRIVVWVVIIVGIGTALFLFYNGKKQKIASSNQKDNQIAFKLIQTGAPNIELGKQIVVKSESEWNTLIGSKSDIQFNKEMALAVFMGKKMTGGYSIEISSIIEKPDKLIVAVQMISPGKNCFVIQAITYPYLVVTVPKTNKEIIWDINGVVRDCPQ